MMELQLQPLTFLHSNPSPHFIFGLDDAAWLLPRHLSELSPAYSKSNLLLGFSPLCSMFVAFWCHQRDREANRS